MGSDLGSHVNPRLWLRLRFYWRQGLGQVWVRSGSPCEPEVVVESEAWLESRVGVGPGSPCKPEVVVSESELWLVSRVVVEHVSTRAGGGG